MTGSGAGERGQVGRRRLLGLLGAGAAGTLAGAGGIAAARAPDPGPLTDLGRAPRTERVVPFRGAHQAGIATPVQAHLHMAALDVTSTVRTELADLLQRWTVAAEAMCAGRTVGQDGAVEGHPLAPPEDTGEALDLDASRLTLTVGLGPSLFDGRFGLAGRRPPALADLPPFAGDALDPGRCGGDLVLQACADDPQVAVHAVRQLTRMAAGVAAVRWAQLGYGRAATTSRDEPTPRNLFGFKDGTANVQADDEDLLAEHVWASAQDGEPARAAWMAGGSYLVARRVAMHIETWDRTSLQEQEVIMGRTKGEGAPLGRLDEHDEVEPRRLPPASHVALAHPSSNAGARMLRRGYNFVDGSDGLGHLDAGLFFLAYQRDPRTAFVPVQTRLARHDRLSEYLRHTGSGVWAVPPGVGDGGWWGETLLG